MSQKHKGRKHTPSRKPEAFPEDRRQYLLVRAQKHLRNEEGQKHTELGDCCPHIRPSCISNSRSLFFCSSFHSFPSSSGESKSPYPHVDWKSVNNKSLLMYFPQTRFHGQLHNRHPRRRCVGNWLIQCSGIYLHQTWCYFIYFLFIDHSSYPWTSCQGSSCFQTGLLLAIVHPKVTCPGGALKQDGKRLRVLATAQGRHGSRKGVPLTQREEKMLGYFQGRKRNEQGSPSPLLFWMLGLHN